MRSTLQMKKDCLVRLVTMAALALGAVHAAAAAENATGYEAIARLGGSGGLCVQLGAGDTALAVQLARSGRYLVQVLEDDDRAVQQARQRLQQQNLYGLISVERWEGGKLPYTENLVNLLIVASAQRQPINAAEIQRVVCPLGIVLDSATPASSQRLAAAGLQQVQEINAGGRWLAGRKPWPAQMDDWSHPRHGADGNAVSRDTLVSPPRRIRWVVNAETETRGLVTAAGRNFYAGVLARDSFNGLRLWSRDLVNPQAKGRFVLKNLPRQLPSPVADSKYLFAVVNKELAAMDAATGRLVRTYPEAGVPLSVLHDGSTLVVVTSDSVRGLDVESGALLWNLPATEPRNVVFGDDVVALLRGNPRRGEQTAALALDRTSGTILWSRNDLPWLPKVSRCVYHAGTLAYEISTYNNDGPDNALHLLWAADGKSRLDHPFLPGMNHRRQARAMFVGDRLWVLHGGKDADQNRQPTLISAIDLVTGQASITHKAGLAHCFPPVATPNYLFSGELDLTNLVSGEVDANRITKANCSADFGWLPANGLTYVTPKHCVCWPMLRGYAALAGARPGGNEALKDVSQLEFPLVKGVAAPADAPSEQPQNDWPCYRHDAWRSSATHSNVPDKLKTLWSVDLGDVRQLPGPITADWRENPFIKGAITPPVVAGGLVYVARPDAHEVVALEADSGATRWRFTAEGRVDTPPTIHRGLCLFGSKNGWVYCLRADDGRLVWRRRAAPMDERIVAYGQVESPWPVPGSVLVVDDVAYFAAGRQSLADGGILFFAVEPASGEIRWVQRLNTVPQEGFYRSSGLEFDNFDLLHREGKSVAMSRWLFDRQTGQMSIEPWKAFARLDTGGGSAMVPQGCWTYAPRHQKRTATFRAKRPLVVFRDNVLLGCSQYRHSIYRRDFDPAGDEQFDAKWMTGWAAGKESREGGMAWRAQRLAEKASWSVDLYDEKTNNQTVEAMVLAGDKLLLVSSAGELHVVSATDGKLLSQQQVPQPLWDGLAVAGGRVWLSTPRGRLVCLGE